MTLAYAVQALALLANIDEHLPYRSYDQTLEFRVDRHVAIENAIIAIENAIIHEYGDGTPLITLHERVTA